jgi:hypothetical protein
MIKITTVNMNADKNTLQFDFLPTVCLLVYKKYSQWILCFHWLWFGIHIKNH